ncbi:MAG TPA: ABC transporter permease [Candidatus Methylomirabilis sp.]|nr:ABC transporter permease [Candidatus Methylomirabilis sp.]
MTHWQKIAVPLAALVTVHLLVVFAGFVAPYDVATQFREHPYAPPSRVHFRDEEGHIHIRPFVYAWKNTGNFAEYEEDTERIMPVRFFVPGDAYTMLHVLHSSVHLFGVEGPAHIFILGSDAYGRDQFSRLLFGGQISLFSGILAAALSLSLGLLLGSAAGYYGGLLDAVLMRISEVFLALPWLYLLFAVRAFLPLRMSAAGTFLLLIAIVGAVGWTRPARLVRGIVLSAKERSYVFAARGFGATDWYLLRRHVLPQTRGVLLTQAAILIPQFILAEVTLSFLGLGVAEPVPSWGNMLSALQQYNVLSSYWWMIIPGLVLIPIFLSYYLLARCLEQQV